MSAAAVVPGSVRQLAQFLADLRADGGERGSLVAFSSKSSPFEVRDSLDAFYRLRDVGRDLRARMLAEGEPLRDRLIMACLCQEVEDAILVAHRWLSRHARRGTRGAVRPSMAHGCAAPLSAVGSALEVSAVAPQTAHADPAFSGPGRQDLPAGDSVDHTQPEREASLCA
ncbi:hypothetical protein GCM10027159_11000 [Lysobacter terrae]